MEPATVALLASPDWHRDALCVEYPHVDFFPGQGDDARPAKAICARCIVRAECRAYITAAPADLAAHGVWAGTTGQERTRLRRREAAAQADEIHPCAGCGREIPARLKSCSSTCRSRVQRQRRAA
jgi:WhiB family redox-sensing transcriptional regulator